MRPFIIAEAGINHNGNLNIAKRLVDESISAGADAVKFQTFWNLGVLEKYELKEEDFLVLKDYCDSLGIEFMTTPHRYVDIQFVDNLVKRHKVASPFLTRYEFLKEINKTHKPILLSTGSISNDNFMATNKEILSALKTLRGADVTLLHCVSQYPCYDPKYERINELRELFDVPIGLSDHSKNLNPPKDVPVIEKHIMLEDVQSIDYPVSLTPSEFSKMVDWLVS